MDRNYGQWIQIELKNTILDISAYAIGYGGENHPKTFDFSISYDGVNWKTVHTHPESDDLYLIDGKIYKVKRTNARFFKWTNRGEPRYFYIATLDLYGTVYSCNPDFDCSFFPHLPKKTKSERHFQLSNFFVFIMILDK